MKVTLTGVDRNTDLKSLPKGCEIGLLYSATNTGNRYLSEDEICRISKEIYPYNSVAIHVCGNAAKDKMFREHQSFFRMSEYCDRIQINGRVHNADLYWFCKTYHDRRVITQHTKANEDLLFVDWKLHDVLVDDSGGRGISPEKWTRPDAIKRVGFAGGLGPENVFEELQKIKEVAVEPSWIDMESKLRTADWFDVEKAHKVMSEINKVLENPVPIC